MVSPKQAVPDLIASVTTPYHSQYWALSLSVKGGGESFDRLSHSISSAKVDLNPHQVDAALFAVRSPLSKGSILADEVGLGKTIEAGIVISQRWAERRRKILLILPATLRKQWQQELLEKFSIPCTILESASFNQARREKKPKPNATRNAVSCMMPKTRLMPRGTA
ncbi:MAG: SNF2-related protein [Sulfuricellaceae bacterium]|nr:SNF2-related protein [Sulfuricellaceae bacterium]